MQEHTNKQITILAIDSNTQQLGTLMAALEAAGYRCHGAHDAASAQQEACTDAPDLIISDVNLVGHGGQAVCEELKARAGINHVPVMYLSATQVPDIIRRTHGNDSSYYLRKSVDAKVLLQLVEKTCGCCGHSPCCASDNASSSEITLTDDSSSGDLEPHLTSPAPLAATETSAATHWPRVEVMSAR